MKATKHLATALSVASSSLLFASQPLVIDGFEAAGISGLNVASWDRSFLLAPDGKTELVEKGEQGKAESAVWGSGEPGAMAFDAVHRSLLVRFPGAAEKIEARLRQGESISKVELVLPFRGTELWPIGYNDPAGMSFLGNQWAETQPRWHAVAWALRKPWMADEKKGPTYNAAISGVLYWKKFGAQDENEDRFPHRFGPAELSSQAVESLDVTDLFRNDEFGATLGDRLSVVDHNGFLIRKMEVYDAAAWKGGYEWGTARGPQAILVGAPQLRVSFEKSGTPEVLAGKSSSPDAASYLSTAGGRVSGEPSAIVPTEQEFEKLKANLGFSRPDWAKEDWQWQRLQELDGLDRQREFPETYAGYKEWIDEQLRRAPRSWYGFDASDTTRAAFVFKDAMPDPLRDHWAIFWWAWLIPDRAYDGFEVDGKSWKFAQGYVGSKEAKEYIDATGDWRGNFSVFRTYAREMGTMNFNHWASAGVLLGGALIQSPEMISEGRKGLENFPLRLWSWFDGSSQESIDHYYFAHSLAAQKVFADHGPEAEDKLMGEAILAKSIEELASAYHPGLRRFQSTSGRTGVAYLLANQDGLQSVMHTLSPSGAITDLGKRAFSGENAEEITVLGSDFPVGRTLQRSLDGQWAPSWFANIVDGKQLPYEATSTYKQWGAFSETPLIKRTYLGENYGIGSLDVSVQNETVPFMAQWRSKPEQVKSAADLRTLLVRPGINRTELLDSVYHGSPNRNPNGTVGTQGSHLATLHDKNRAILLASPMPKLEYSGGRNVPEIVNSLQVTAGLLRFDKDRPWSIYVDGKPVTSLPFRGKYGSKITIDDGSTYIALLPIPAGNLERDLDFEIVDDGQMTEMQGGGKAREALRINAYMFRSDKPLDKSDPQLDLAYGGFVVELGDVNEYGSFSEFQKRIAATGLQTKWNEGDKTLDVTYRTGEDTLHAVYKPDYAGNWDQKPPTTALFPVREVNGQWPYMAKGIDRDTGVSQQGTTGFLEKHGHTLKSDPGKMTYLVSEPVSGTVSAFSPFSEPNSFDLALADGTRVTADGTVGITRVEVAAKSGDFMITSSEPTGGSDRPAAGRMLIFAKNTPSNVLLNGKAVQAEATTVDGKQAFAVSLAH